MAKGNQTAHHRSPEFFFSNERTRVSPVKVNVIETIEKVIDVPVVKQVEVPQVGMGGA